MNDQTPKMSARTIGLILGPLIALLMIISGGPSAMPYLAWLTAACMAWMAIWWMTEAVPVAVTALLPIVLFPLLGIASIKVATVSYAHPTIYLFLGGFVLALAIERWNLHKRVALSILLATNGDARTLMGGFMVTAALLSMWISNTATSIMLLPMGLAIIAVVSETVTDVSDKNKYNFQTALLLSIAYAATIGGVATLIGTPPNAFMAAFILDNYGIEIGFIEWMAVGLPITIIMLPIAWLVLSRLAFSFDFQTSVQTRSKLVQMRDELGPMSSEEKRVAAVFIMTALSWAFRPVLDNWSMLSGISDTGIAVIAAISLFLIPAPSTNGERLLDWDATRKLPWGILVLFGGGLSLASAVSSSGLGTAIGEALSLLQTVDMIILVVAVATLIIFLTELTSNLATTATFLPVLGAISLQIGIDPMVLLVPVALAASCAFMLPVATPPNAIVYSSGGISIAQMSRAGLWLNIVGIVVVSAVSILLVPVILLA